MINLTPLARAIFSHRVKKSLRWVGDGEQAQRDQLAWLIAKARRTHWGESYHYEAIRSYEDFAQKVPVSTYEDLAPWIMRQLGGEKDVLWRGRVNRFAQSSGTSNGKSKYFGRSSTLH